MSKLIKHLRSFNRKERFILLKKVLGPEAFQLDSEFRKELGCAIEVDIPEGDGAFVAMDYHLDWIQVAMCFRKEEKIPLDKKIDMCRIDGSMLIEGTPEDIDLLVAFDDRAKTHLVLIEAKGDTLWLYKQLSSKALRLSRIFGSEVLPKDVTPHFVMMSPNNPEPEKLEMDTWPLWMKKMVHLELCLPERLLKVTRGDGYSETGKDGKEGRSYRSFRIKKVN